MVSAMNIDAFLFFIGVIDSQNELTFFHLASRRLALASDEQVLRGPEFDDCWEEMYENALYADSSHISYLAIPKNKDSNCPIIALDNGFSEGVNFEKGGVLAT